MKTRTAIARMMCMVIMLYVPYCFAENAREIYFGSVAMDIPAVMYRRLLPLIKYLSAGLNRPVTLKLAPNMDKAIDDIEDGSVDLAYLTPVAYLRAHARGDARLLVKRSRKATGRFN
jgi:phosphonate transport system substrate-binding protein